MKHFYLVLISLAFTLHSFAGGVTKQQALQKAQQFMPGKHFKQNNTSRAASTANAYFDCFPTCTSPSRDSLELPKVYMP